jgi:hypothetical protein
MKRFLVLAGLAPVVLFACDKKPDATPKPAPSASWVAASASAAPSAVVSAKSASTADAAAPTPILESTFAGYKVDGGQGRHYLVGLERTGDDVLVVLSPEAGGDFTTFEGKMKDPSHFAADEKVGKGRKGGHVDASYGDGGAVDLVLTDPKAKAPLKLHAVASSPFAASGDETFEQSYLGSLGSTLRVRVKWKRDKHLLTGIYRYTHSREDLKLDGTVVASTGAFQLTEKTARGAVTGRFSGAFLSRDVVFGRWYSPDRTRSYALAMAQDSAYPQTVKLMGGETLSAQEDFSERGKTCKASNVMPVFGGFQTAPLLNEQIKKLAGPKVLTKDDCDGATDELPYEFEQGFTITGQKKGYVGLSLSSYEYTGGAHGMYGFTCVVADIANHALVPLGALLTDDARAKLSALVNADFQKQFGEKDLTNAGFFDATVKVEPSTSLCFQVDEKGTTTLEVAFGPYEVAPWAMGSPSANVAAADAKALFPAGSVGEAVFK